VFLGRGFGMPLLIEYHAAHITTSSTVSELTLSLLALMIGGTYAVFSVDTSKSMTSRKLAFRYATNFAVQLALVAPGIGSG
jgi:hypothetical protein